MSEDIETKIIRILDQVAKPLTEFQLAKRCGCLRDEVSQAIRHLLDEGYVDLIEDPRRDKIKLNAYGHRLAFTGRPVPKPPIPRLWCHSKINMRDHDE